MASRYNPPPNWPPPPAGWTPGPGWRPDPAWGPPPTGWQLWVQDPATQPPVAVSAPPNASSAVSARAKRLLLRAYLGPTRNPVRRAVRATLLGILTLSLLSAPFSDTSTKPAATATTLRTTEAPPPAAASPAAVGSTAAVPSAAPPSASPTADEPVNSAAADTALAALGTLAVKGRAPRTGYAREAFGQAWADTNRNGCDTRNDILRRDLTGVDIKPGTNSCVVLSGRLADPYTAQMITFVRGGTSEVDIDHVVALGDSWQTGAFAWPVRKRLAFANDPLNLLAVEASANRQKGDANAASWLPSHRAYRCAYVARQVAVKARYQLWVVPPERDAMRRVLSTCPTLVAPKGTAPTIAPIAPSQHKTSPPKPAPTTASPKPKPKPKPSKQFVAYTVHPGAFCSEQGYYGYTSRRVLMRCQTSPTDSRYRWRRA